MTMQDYRNARIEAKKEIDTLKRVVEEAYWKAQRSTTGTDDLDNLESLNQGTVRNNFIQTITGDLVDGARTYFRSRANLSALRLNRMVEGYCGIELKAVSELIEGLKGEMDSSAYQFFLQKKTRLQQKLQSALNPSDYFSDAADRNNVLAEVGLARNARINPNQLSAADLANLLDEFDANGVVRPVFLKKQHYFH